MKLLFYFCQTNKFTVEAYLPAISFSRFSTCFQRHFTFQVQSFRQFESLKFKEQCHGSNLKRMGKQYVEITFLVPLRTSYLTWNLNLMKKRLIRICCLRGSVDAENRYLNKFSNCCIMMMKRCYQDHNIDLTK